MIRVRASHNFNCLVPKNPSYIICTVLSVFAMRPLIRLFVIQLVGWALFVLRVGRKMAKVSSFLQKTRCKGNNLFERMVIIALSL